MKLIDRLAEIENRQWRKWAMTLLEQEPGISAERRERCIKLVNTPWDELSEDWKEHDRQKVH